MQDPTQSLEEKSRLKLNLSLNEGGRGAARHAEGRAVEADRRRAGDSNVLARIVMQLAAGGAVQHVTQIMPRNGQDPSKSLEQLK